jgi:hypothetical protein
VSRPPENPEGRKPDPLVDDALALWREDAARAAADVDPDEIADAALDAAAEGRVAWRSERVAGRYAAAALVLLGLGVGGTVATVVAAPKPPAAPQSLGSIESERFRLQSAREVFDLPVVEPKSPEVK